MVKDSKLYYYITFNELFRNKIISIKQIYKDEILTKKEVLDLINFEETPRLIDFLKINYFYGKEFFDEERINKDMDNPIFKV
ncbi:MAG: hypothetical protein ACOVNU_03060 [Candidatus Kapaibacteriota bacterium]